MKKFYSFFLSVLLILPSIVSFAHHVFEDHKICTETEIHFHQDEINCSTCLILSNTENNFTSLIDFNYNLVSIDELVLTPIDLKLVNNPIGFNLRGPPTKS